MRAESHYAQPELKPEPEQAILHSPQPVERRKSIQSLHNGDDGQQSPTKRQSIETPLHKIVENPIDVIESNGTIMETMSTGKNQTQFITEMVELVSLYRDLPDRAYFYVNCTREHLVVFTLFKANVHAILNTSYECVFFF